MQPNYRPECADYPKLQSKSGNLAMPLELRSALNLCNMYNRPLRKRVFEQFGAVSGADMYPAS